MERPHKRQKKAARQDASYGCQSQRPMLPDAPVFYPTSEQFREPLEYIASIEGEASRYGICKIVPPEGCRARTSIDMVDIYQQPNLKRGEFETRQQWLLKQEWPSFCKDQFFEGGTFTLETFQKLAKQFFRAQYGKISNEVSTEILEEGYWQYYHRSSDEVDVQYGTDVEGSAFRPPESDCPLGGSGWNMQVLAKDMPSILRHSRKVPGVTTPMLYMSMLFSAFGWHTEDLYLYSINYQHLGAKKIWYGVPASGADQFEDMVSKQVYKKATAAATARRQSEATIRDMTLKTLVKKGTIFNPQRLTEAGVPVYRLEQAPGEFVVTFPQAYHSGFALGFSVGEAVNFATGSWFPFGLAASLRDRRQHRALVLDAEGLLCSEARFLASLPAVKRETHVNRAACAEFVRMMDRYTQNVVEAMGHGATMQAPTGSRDLRLPCDLCGYPCPIAKVVLSHKSLYACFRCCTAQPKYFVGAKVVLDWQYSELQEAAEVLRGNAGLTGVMDCRPPTGVSNDQSQSDSDCATVVPLLKSEPQTVNKERDISVSALGGLY